MMPKPQPKKDDGVIHMVQRRRATSSSPRPQVAAATPSRRTQNADTYDRRDSDPFDAPRTRRGAARSASFADPFADSSPAPRARVVAPPPRPVAPPTRAPAMTRREPAAPPPGWRDPFSDGPSDRKPAKRAAETKAPAGHPPGWKDPFSDAAPVRAHRTVVALSDSRRSDDSTASKHAAASSKTGNWGLLKKQPRR